MFCFAITLRGPTIVLIVDPSKDGMFKPLTTVTLVVVALASSMVFVPDMKAAGGNASRVGFLVRLKFDVKGLCSTRLNTEVKLLTVYALIDVAKSTLPLESAAELTVVLAAVSGFPLGPYFLVPQTNNGFLGKEVLAVLGKSIGFCSHGQLAVSRASIAEPS